jgi:hypothetical protein
MAEPHVVSTLTNKRNEIEARIAAYEREIENARRDLAAINATLALFLQEGELRPHMGLSRMFRRGELFQLCKGALEAAGSPLDTRELAKAVAEAKDLDGQDRVLRKAIALSIVNVMARQAKRGMIVAVGRQRGVRIWASL